MSSCRSQEQLSSFCSYAAVSVVSSKIRQKVRNKQRLANRVFDRVKRYRKHLLLEFSTVCSSTLLFPLTVYSEAQACSTSIVGISCSNPTVAMDVPLLMCCVGSGLCDELITRSEQSYRVCVCVCVLCVSCVIQKPQNGAA